MEDYITVSAKTLDDAITEALVQLGVTSDRLDYIAVSYTHLTLPTNSLV